MAKGCGFCGAARGRFVCRACGSILGAPLFFWVMLALFGIGFYAIFADKVPHG